MQNGIVYTETTVYSPPDQFANDAPYQIAIIDLQKGSRCTVRILENRVQIGDHVVFAEERDGVAYYRKSETS
jgi:uncharacterized OB-fold protein